MTGETNQNESEKLPEKPSFNGKRSRNWLIVSILLLIISVLLLSANPIYQYFTTRQVKSELKAIKLEDLTNVEVPPSIKPGVDLSDEEIYVGKIAIPAVNLSLPIVKGAGEENLFRGAATNTTNQKLGQGNYSLSSHKMPYDDTLLFSPLLKVKKDDMIYLTDGKSVYQYKVYEIFVVSPDKIEILDEIPERVVTTLYTCETDAGVDRHVVRGTLTAITALADTDKKIVELFD